MTNAARFSLNVGLAIGCLAVGLWAGIAFQGNTVAPDYVNGDFSALRRETGMQVVLFSTTTCSHCRAAREFLDREHVEYKDFVVDQSADAQARFAALGGDAVPLLLIGDRAVRGFREDAIRQSLAALPAHRAH